MELLTDPFQWRQVWLQVEWLWIPLGHDFMGVIAGMLEGIIVDEDPDGPESWWFMYSSLLNWTNA